MPLSALPWREVGGYSRHAYVLSQLETSGAKGRSIAAWRRTRFARSRQRLTCARSSVCRTAPARVDLVASPHEASPNVPTLSLRSVATPSCDGWTRHVTNPDTRTLPAAPICAERVPTGSSGILNRAVFGASLSRSAPLGRCGGCGAPARARAYTLRRLGACRQTTRSFRTGRSPKHCTPAL
jgi:hypothetical protein